MRAIHEEKASRADPGAFSPQELSPRPFSWLEVRLRQVLSTVPPHLPQVRQETSLRRHVCASWENWAGEIWLLMNGLRHRRLGAPQGSTLQERVRAGRVETGRDVLGFSRLSLVLNSSCRLGLPGD